MNNVKSRIIELITKQNISGSLIEDLKDEKFELMCHEQTNEDFLDINEVYLANNRQLGQVVPGLKETIDKVKKAGSKTVIVNTIEKDGKSVIIYTDSSYSNILGIV